MEPGSAVVDEGEFGSGLAGVCRTTLSWYGRRSILLRIDLLVRCLSAISVSSVTIS